MRELDKRIATLRLRLAEINSREEQIRAQQRQFRAQINRLMDFAIYDQGDLDSALSMAGEVDTRLAQADTTLRHLETIRARGQEELNALLLTRNIEAAKADVADLETQLKDLDEEIARLQRPVTSGVPASGSEDDPRLAELRGRHDGIDAEIKRLRHAISEASDQAARAVTDHPA